MDTENRYRVHPTVYLQYNRFAQWTHLHRQQKLSIVLSEPWGDKRSMKALGARDTAGNDILGCLQKAYPTVYIPLAVNASDFAVGIQCNQVVRANLKRGESELNCYFVILLLFCQRIVPRCSVSFPSKPAICKEGCPV